MDEQTGWLTITLIAAERLAAMGAVVHAIYRKRRNPTSAASWALACVFVPILGTLFYVVIGAERIQRRVLRRRRRSELRVHELIARAQPLPAEATDEQALAVRAGLGPLGGNAFVSGNALAIHVDGDAAYPAMLAAIRSAQRCIAVASYIFDSRRTEGDGKEDAVSRELLAALVERARAGVQVRVLYDAVGSLHTPARFFASLRDAGGRVQEFFPRLHAWRLNFRDHRKLLLVDNRTGFVSTLNISEQHMRSGPCFGSHDWSLEITGPVTEQLRLAFEREWLFATDEDLEAEDVETAPPAGACAVQVLEGGPFQHDPVFLTSLVSAIHHARHEVLLVTPYFLPDATLRAAIRTAAQRGVAVSIMVPQNCRHGLVNLARMTDLRVLAAEYGVRVLFLAGPLLHLKLAIIDQEVVYLGSSNLDSRSLFLNFELDVVVASRQFARCALNTLAPDMEAAVMLEDTRPPFMTRWCERAAALFAPLL
jgi:cardiolipin synthase